MIWRGLHGATAALPGTACTQRKGEKARPLPGFTPAMRPCSLSLTPPASAAGLPCVAPIQYYGIFDLRRGMPPSLSPSQSPVQGRGMASPAAASSSCSCTAPPTCRQPGCGLSTPTCSRRDHAHVLTSPSASPFVLLSPDHRAAPHTWQYPTCGLRPPTCGVVPAELAVPRLQGYAPRSGTNPRAGLCRPTWQYPTCGLCTL